MTTHPMTAPVPAARDRSGEGDATFARELARLEAAPAAGESWATVERVAQAIADADDCDRAQWPGMYEERALAAVLALETPDAAAVRRVLALAEELDREADRSDAEGDRLDANPAFRLAAHTHYGSAGAEADAARRIRAAIAGPTQ